MGMYTELKIKAKLVNKEPIKIFLENMVAWTTENTIWWDKRNPIWGWSAYFNDWEDPRIEEEWEFLYFTWQGNIKNYESEIEKFLSIIEPFIVHWEWHIHYEEYNNPEQKLVMREYYWRNKAYIEDTWEEIER